MVLSLTPRGNEWADVVEVLRAITNLVTVRSHYEEGHPAIAKADENAAARFSSMLVRLPEIVLALVDGEFVVCERPMPDLRARLPVLADTMTRHEVECIVFQRGITAAECTHLGRILGATKGDPVRARELAQTNLVHVLFRWAELQSQSEARRGNSDAQYFVPIVEELLQAVGRSVGQGAHVDRAAVRAVAKDVVRCCAGRTFQLAPRCHTDGVDDLPAHSVNVAMMTAAMTLDAQLPESTCIDATAAALLHDIGHMFLPAHVRGIPAPLLDEAGKAIFRHHAFVGAGALLGAACPPLWVAAALEHHRGIDGKGYPNLETQEAPHELVRTIALASFHDRKRTLLRGIVDEPEDTLRHAHALRDRYFGRAPLARFVRALGVYPPGTTVELSDRAAAIVMEASIADPLRPVVRVVCGERAGKRIDLKTLDALEERHALSIVRAIAPPLLRSDAEEAREESAPALAVDVSMPTTASAPIAARLSAIPAATIAPVRRLSGTYSSVRIDEAPEAETKPPVRSSALPPRMSSTGPPPADPPAPEVIERAYLTRIGSLDRVPVVLVATTALATMGLDHRAGFLLTFIDGNTTLDDILDACGLPRADALPIVADLLQRKIIGVRG